ncbi:hypothetical protein SISNIDRAFT_491483 [Sistotremastrum niveocremeum HHB9708]|uniref:Uncharacterized protein n=1 Tax=Sistotremastrum niveocremeum HHB9708 TaxID=1314777 RepID=A0A164MS11_9AGAM|nr:hypothetical protein SISNIDRAFT_491483 [Sistotremastrum niveocremeum HHB9708]
MAYNNQGYPTESNPEQLGLQFSLNSPEPRHQSTHRSNVHAAAQSSQSADRMQIDAGSASALSGLQHAPPFLNNPTIGGSQNPPFHTQYNPLLDNPLDDSYNVGSAVAQNSPQPPVPGVTWNQSGAQGHSTAVPPPYNFQPHVAGVPAAPINSNPQPYAPDLQPPFTGPQPAEAAANPPDHTNL